MLFAWLLLAVQAIHIHSQEYPLPPQASSESCAFGLDDSSSPFDCYPEPNASEEECVNRGCCWHATTPGRPFCYFPQGFKSFEVQDGNYLQRKYRSQFPEDVNRLRIDVSTGDHLGIRISDPENERWVPVYPKIATNWNVTEAEKQWKLNEDGDLIQFYRANKRVAAVPIDTVMFSDQFIQLTFDLPGATLHGVGEHRTRLVLSDNWTKYALWNHDDGPSDNANLYGSHPFLLAVNASGESTGIYFHNSNAVEVVLQPGPKVTFRSIGGILEFHIFDGPSPADVVSQYTKFVGLPPMPPYWALGFHLCRWGYGSANNTRAIWQKMRDNMIPFDVQWNDIDYMRGNNDFTIDPVNFAELPQLVEDIHAAGMHYVSMLDPGVSGSEKVPYPPFTDGVEMDVFVKDINGDILLGHVWNPNATAYPDFTHPRALEYWSKQLREFRDVIKYDAIWIDMNEPSNFADGSPTGCPDSKLETPPYLPALVDGKLQAWTICMTSQHSIGPHYNVHNLYAIAEADVTRRALEDIIGKRTFLITRASFAGVGKYAGHWSGDNNSAWSEMVSSIVELLTFSLYGVPFMGADICGFGGEADAELCNRWSQLGAFYTFSRNHNSINNKEQSPVSFGDDVTKSVALALANRYALLPYLYTLFYEAQVNGATVARPLFFEFPTDAEARKVDRAFLWGSGLYIVPVLEAGATSVTAYLPDARWFDFESGQEILEKGSVELQAPFDKIPLLLRGGSIIPTQPPEVTTAESRKGAVIFIVVPDSEGKAKGSLFWDDGESLNPVDNGAYGVLDVTLSSQKISSTIRQWKTEELTVEKVAVYGVTWVNSVTVNGHPANFTIIDSCNGLRKLPYLECGLIVKLSNQLASKPFEVTWS